MSRRPAPRLPLATKVPPTPRQGGGPAGRRISWTWSRGPPEIFSFPWCGHNLPGVLSFLSLSSSPQAWPTLARFPAGAIDGGVARA